MKRLSVVKLFVQGQLEVQYEPENIKILVIKTYQKQDSLTQCGIIITIKNHWSGIESTLKDFKDDKKVGGPKEGEGGKEKKEKEKG